jgi:hypothetical protein
LRKGTPITIEEELQRIRSAQKRVNCANKKKEHEKTAMLTRRVSCVVARATSAGNPVPAKTKEEYDELLVCSLT